MTPRHMFAWMAVLAAALVAGTAAALLSLQAAFAPPAPLNAAILALLAAGVLVDFWHVHTVGKAVGWVDRVRRGFSVKEPPRLVAALARVLAGHEREGFTVSAVSMAALQDGVRTRLREAREIPGRLAVLLAMLGLLGGAWALLREQPGAASSAVLFGFAAAVVLGAFNALARHAQNLFMRELEEFLAQRAELPSTVLGGEGALPAYLEALLKQSAESLTEIQRMMVRNEEERRGTQAALTLLTERLTELSDHMRAEHKVLVTLSRSHNQLQPAIADLAAEVAGAAAASEEIRSHLRNIDVAAARLVDEVSAARAQTPDAVRQELKVLTQTLAPGVLRKAS